MEQKEKNKNYEYPIKIEHVKKSFGQHQVLKDVNLKVKENETIVVLGKSGTGKSVILQCIAGLLTPDSGRVEVLGKNIPELTEDELQEVRKGIGFLFQSGALYDSMTVRDNLMFPLRRSDLSAEEMQEKVETALEDVGLLESIDKMPSELSGGMRKRIGLARTIITNPAIILYDEPTTGLDTATSKDISNLIIEMKDKYKVSSIVITHDMACAKKVADRIVVLKEGEYKYEGTYEELEKHEDPFVRSFFEFE